ncbi:esterase FE4-like [Hyposmocoma kahamanoa]|uniref:esterase FE4-like n=1 Tax=Hyposmocoma kahamanoa TaxID=1477025 RepID=UPI000E6D8CDB|nr:esterase FE4-like [Hyposmocoma kahamanoa]
MSCKIKVEQGVLQGKECISCYGKKYYSFEGIPYAKPPVGKLRFRDPQKPDTWSGILDATKPGPKCSQMNPLSGKGVEGSEDCLYLNVYTPSLPQEELEKLPVIFFVHGGSYLFGHGDYYRPDYYIDKDVVLVTINYRLHILGFLCLHTENVPGNAAFKDTIMALKWVKNNIKYFNGDENNVTAFGDSAGGSVTSSYTVTKMADGLVHKIITQSGVCISDLLFTEEDPIAKAKQV